MQAIIIGSSLRARSVAIRLAARGWSVQLLTGRCASDSDAPLMPCEVPHPQRHQGRPFVLCPGPGTVTLPFVLLDLFAAAGVDVREYLQLTRIEPPLRFIFPDEFTLDLASEPIPSWLERFTREAQRLWSNADELRLLDHLARQQSRRSLSAVIERWYARWRIGCNAPLARLIDREVDDRRLQEALAAFVSPVEPRACPAAAGMFFHAMLHFGAFHIVGGMHRLDEAIGAILRKTGVRICSTAVQCIRLRSDSSFEMLGVELADGEFLATNALIVESAHTANCLLNLPADSDAPAASIELMLGIDGGLPQLRHSTVLLQRNRSPIHVTAASRIDPSLAPEGCQTLVASTWVDRQTISDPAVAVSQRDVLLSELGKACGVPDLYRQIVVERIVTRSRPRRYPDLSQLAMRHQTVGGLYVMEDAPCPGAELAIEALTGKIACELLCHDLSQN